jgi:hypothetical protein
MVSNYFHRWCTVSSEWRGGARWRKGENEEARRSAGRARESSIGCYGAEAHLRLRGDACASARSVETRFGHVLGDSGPLSRGHERVADLAAALMRAIGVVRAVLEALAPRPARAGAVGAIWRRLFRRNASHSRRRFAPTPPGASRPRGRRGPDRADRDCAVNGARQAMM